jgi:ABC-type sugar transport system ATPase subunit/ribose/xylose/arabinose/galactoside ABC-type transport system permease subunit
MSATIELAGIGKSFPGVVALQDVDLALEPGRVHALLGENGAGKSTLINILGGSLAADHGEIRMGGRIVRFADTHAARRLGIVSVHQEVDLFPDLSVTENIALEQGLPARHWGWIDRRGQRQRARQALGIMRANLLPSALASGLSPAQRQILILAAALSEPARVLILDEPTSSLSAAETDVLFEQVRRLRSEGAAILYVSHRFEEIFALADEATVLRDGRRVWTGSLSETTPEQLIHHMVGRDLDSKPRAGQPALGPVRFRCRNLSAADGAFREINLEVRGGEILGLYGLIGAGRSEWAQGVLGLHPLSSGDIWLNDRPIAPQGPGPMARQGLAYVPEDRLRQGLCRGLSIRANLVLAMLRQLAGGGWLTRRPEVRRTRAAVQALSVRLRSIEQTIGTLSGGNQQKVVVGRWLERQPNVLILDEPTRGIDVAAKAEIHGLVRRLAAEGRAIVFISSDLPEVLSQSDRIGVFREGRLAGLFDPRRNSANEVASAALPDGGGKAKIHQAAAPARETLAAAAAWWKALPLREGGLLVLLLVLLGMQFWRSRQIATAGQLPSLATDAALLSCCALGAAIVLLVGGIDISLGSLMALSAGIAGQLWQEDYPLPLVFAIGVLVGGMGGLVNALVSLVGRVHPIVVTLGTLSLYRGLALWRLKQDVQIPGAARNFLVEPRAGLPLLVWLGLGLALLIGLLLQRSVLGRQIYAVGSNPSAAARAGISRSRIWLAAFTMQGMLAGLAGLLYLARSGQLQAVSYEDTTLQAIAAAVVGGVAITGGRGTVVGVVLGCLFLVALPPACEFLHIPTIWQRTLVGAVLVVAVTLDALWRRRQT